MMPSSDIPPKYVIERKAPSYYFQAIRPNYIDWGKYREDVIEQLASIVGDSSIYDALDT